MNKIIQYNILTDIELSHNKNYKYPLTTASNIRFYFDLKELELHYNEEFGTYITEENTKKLGGNNANNERRIKFICNY